jgi:hypothetical protein
MKTQYYFLIAVALIAVGIVLTACTPPVSSEPCMFTLNDSATAYRLPDNTSDVFGTASSGETFEALARTADGWLGFDPGVAQAGNIGLAHHRWIQLNATVSPSCLESVSLVTLQEVEADVAASGG